MNAEVALSNDQIRQIAPSVFAGHPAQKVSRRYAFLPTASILQGMREAGWRRAAALAVFRAAGRGLAFASPAADIGS